MDSTEGMVDGTAAGIVLDALGLAVVATDLHGVVTAWNAGAQRLYGWSRSEAMGRPAIDLLVPESSRPAATALLGPLRAARPWFGEFDMQCRDGSRFTASVSAWPVRAAGTGAMHGIVGILQRAPTGTDAESDEFDPDAVAVEIVTRAFDPELRAAANADPHATVLPTAGLSLAQLDELLASLVALAVHTASVGADRAGQPPQRIVAAAALRLRGR
jgi:PAS domain S-box-containing protein